LLAVSFYNFASHALAQPHCYKVGRLEAGVRRRPHGILPALVIDGESAA